LGSDQIKQSVDGEDHVRRKEAELTSQVLEANARFVTLTNQIEFSLSMVLDYKF